MKDLVNFTTRLQKLLAYYELSASGLATKIGVQRSSISHIVSGRNKPSLDFIIKLLDTFDEVSFDWIINGKGAFPKSEAPTPISKPTENLFTSATEKRSNPIVEKKIPLSHLENSPNTLKENTTRVLDKIILLYKDGSFESYKK